MAGALAGTEWLDGGLDDDGVPIWPPFSLGDTGNGLLAAVAIIQALLHRDRTGEGQYVETSIIYAHLLNSSFTWVAADGEATAKRPSVDADLRGWTALYRLYRASDDWICLAAATDSHWASLCTALGADALARDPRFATARARAEHDSALVAVLDTVFEQRTAVEWFERLDAHGVPVELATPDRVIAMFDDESLKERGWIVSYEHPVVGRMEAVGRFFDFSATPGPLPRAAPISGQDTADILGELGYGPSEINALARAGAVELA
jgi:crotonobetainyl-CoA:carnitine CoA-transferase CaiB-like acyl-CoA transferase